MTSPRPPLRSLPPLPPDLGKQVEDALYVSVGLGVLALQQAQVRRRELERLVGRVWRELQGKQTGARPPA